MTEFLKDKFSSRPSNDAYRDGWDNIDWSKKAPEPADTLDELPNDAEPNFLTVGGLVLPGWFCAACGVFNGEAKENLNECRSCQRPKQGNQRLFSPEEQRDILAHVKQQELESAKRAPLLPSKSRCNRVHDSWHPCQLDPGHDGPCNSTGIAEPAHINEIERDILREGKETNHLMRGDSPFKSVAVRNYGPQNDRFNSYLMESEGMGWKGYSEFRCTSHAVVRRRVSYPISTSETQVTLPEWEEGPWEALSPSEIITYGSSSRWRAWVNERSR